MLSLVACACKLPPLLGASSWQSRARAGEISGTGIRWPHCYSERMRDSERGELWQFGDYDHQRLEAKKVKLKSGGLSPFQDFDTRAPIRKLIAIKL